MATPSEIYRIEKGAPKLYNLGALEYYFSYLATPTSVEEVVLTPEEVCDPYKVGSCIFTLCPGLWTLYYDDASFAVNDGADGLTTLDFVQIDTDGMYIYVAFNDVGEVLAWLCCDVLTLKILADE